MGERQELAAAARLHLRKVTRIVELWEQGLSDTSIAEQLGWCRRTVLRYRHFLRLQRGNPNGRRRGLGVGRWCEALDEFRETFEALEER